MMLLVLTCVQVRRFQIIARLIHLKRLRIGQGEVDFSAEEELTLLAGPSVETWASERFQIKFSSSGAQRSARVRETGAAAIVRSVQPPRESRETAKRAPSGTLWHRRPPACGRRRSCLCLWAVT